FLRGFDCARFIHRKGDLVFSGLEIQALALMMSCFVSLLFITIAVVPTIGKRIGNFTGGTKPISNPLFLQELYIFVVSLYYFVYFLWIGYRFGKENEQQLNRLQRQKIILYSQTMKHLLKQEKYHSVDVSKIEELKMLVGSMDALVQHVGAKEITPQLWGIRMNNFHSKAVITALLAVIPSIIVRIFLDNR
ncbi:hypothetical protein RFI_16917, partial [Reticulomyxa filosa]